MMKKKDFIIIGSLLVVAIVAFVWATFFTVSEGSIAKVYYQNEVVIEVDFNDQTYQMYPQNDAEDYPKLIDTDDKSAADLTFIVLGFYEIEGIRTEAIIEVNFQTKSIRIAKDETPKQIGVSRGWYDGKGLPVVSLPNQIFIKFEQEATDEVDGAV